MRLRRPLRVLAGLLALALLVTVLIAPVTEIVAPARRWAVVPVPLPRDTGTYHLYVSDLGYHTSITIEQPGGWHLGPPGAEDAPYLEWGWGDRGFYQYSDFSVRGVYSALFLPTPSVVYLSGERGPPDLRSLKHVWTRTVDGETLRHLVSEMEWSIKHDPSGHRGPASGRVAGYRGQFYSAWGDYFWTRDCNHWVAEQLVAVGLAESAMGVVLSRQVGERLRGFRPLEMSPW